MYVKYLELLVSHGMESLREIMKIQMKGISHQERIWLMSSFWLCIARSSNNIISWYWIKLDWTHFLISSANASPNLYLLPLHYLLFGALWGTPFPNWFGAWKQQFLNQGFKKKKPEAFGDLREITKLQMEGNQSSRKDLNHFFLSNHLLKIINQHHLIVLNQAGFTSFSYFISHPTLKLYLHTLRQGGSKKSLDHWWDESEKDELSFKNKSQCKECIHHRHHHHQLRLQ